MIFMVVTLITLLIMNFFNNMMKDTTSQEITYDEFLEMVDKGLVVTEYDEQGQVSREVEYDGKNRPVRIRKYEYNDNGTKHKQYNYLPNGKLYSVKVRQELR